MAAVTLDQLIALNREICALASAGLPLAEGLVRVAEDFSGPASQLARRLAERIEQGSDLAAAIEAEGAALPASYQAIVLAGLRSGRLPSALEGYTNAAIRVAELRRMLALASIYPLMLLGLVWVLFLFFSSKVWPGFDWLEINDKIWADSLRFKAMGPDSAWRLAIWLGVPLVLIGLSWASYRGAAQAAEGHAAGATRWLRCAPGLARVRLLSCQANFAELLRLFVDQQIPLHVALPLAAQGSGLTAESAELEQAISELESGQSVGDATSGFRSLPPLIRLALLSNQGIRGLSDGLSRAAQSYQERAQNWAQGVALYLPVIFTAGIGGLAVGVYTLLMLQPYVATLYETMNWR